MTPALLLLTLGAPTLWGGVQASTGAEVDTNAKRAVAGLGSQDVLPGASRPQDQVADGLVRLLVDTQAILQINRDHQIFLSYVLGAKRFFYQGTEDLLNHNLTLSTQHQLGSVLSLSGSGWYKSSRIRSGLRDYNLGIASLQAGLRFSDLISLDVGGGVRGLRFYNEPRFDYWGPDAFLRATVSPTRPLTFIARVGYMLRRYAGPALVEGSYPGGEVGPVFCTTPVDPAGFICSPVGNRRDHEGQAELSAQYRRGPLLVRGGYQLRMQRSNGDYENIDRHRAFVQGTWALPWWDITANVMATLQINNGVSVTDTKYLAEDDENQNSLRVHLRRPLFSAVDVELNYSLFANQFSTAQASFLRQTVFLGLRAHLEGSQAM